MPPEQQPTPDPAGREPPPAPNVTEDSLPFQRLGSYDITARIGRGGMGDVYLGYDPALKRQVAIKVLPADLAAAPISSGGSRPRRPRRRSWSIRTSSASISSAKTPASTSS